MSTLFVDLFSCRIMTRLGTRLVVYPLLLLGFLVTACNGGGGAATTSNTSPDASVVPTQNSVSGNTIPPTSGTSPTTPETISSAYWQARHESGNLEEYSWWHPENNPYGRFQVVPDPAGTGRGYVFKGEIVAAVPSGGDSHRLYPMLLMPCYRGAYSSRFLVWADIPTNQDRGWYSFATYSNTKDWGDLFGVNLAREEGEDRLVLFHTPSMGKGEFTRLSRIPFPMRKWVKIEVRVDQNGIMLSQDDRLIAEAKKEWGAEGVGLCEAHWGMYAQGKNSSGVVLNDDIAVTLDTPFEKRPYIVRAAKSGQRSR